MSFMKAAQQKEKINKFVQNEEEYNKRYIYKLFSNI